MSRSPLRLVQSGRDMTPEDVEHIRTVVADFPALSRRELAHTVCEHLGWMTASGMYKLQACLKMLEELERLGMLALPAKRNGGRPPESKPAWTHRTAPGAVLEGQLNDVKPVDLELAVGKEAIGLWNEYVDRHHMLGYQRPFGCTLRYFVTSPRGCLGSVLLAGAAKSIAVRDVWIGWSERQRLNNLPWVVNNTRFLIFGWVRVKHLASHVLGQLARRLPRDWEAHWGYRPALLETFVDPAHFEGTCYRAAGWSLLGKTTGRGLRRGRRAYTTTPKLLYVRPLVQNFRELLCSNKLVGRAST